MASPESSTTSPSSQRILALLERVEAKEYSITPVLQSPTTVPVTNIPNTHQRDILELREV